MSKKILVLALAFVVGITVAAFAEVQNVKIGGDITTVWVDRQNLDFQKASNSISDFATITRVKIEANLTDNVDATVRLLNERLWSSTNENTSGGSVNSDSDITIDEAYVTLKDFLKDTTNVPLTLKVGRQNVRIGSGLLIGDPDTNQNVSTTSGLNVNGLRDLSARKSFDAIVGVLDYDPLTVTAGYIKGSIGTDVNAMKDDVNAYVINAAYDTGVKDTIAEATYLLYRQRETKANVANYGIRLTSTPIENLSLEGEFVFQDSETAKADKKRQQGSDSAISLCASYLFEDVVWKPKLGMDYGRLSGQWNPLFEDLTPAELANLIFPNTNVSVIGGSLLAKPKDDVTLKLRYANFQVVEKYYDTETWASPGTGATYTMTDKKDLGDEIDLGVVYDYTEDVQLGLTYAMFMPGDAFSSVNEETATSVIGSMRVAF
ncbi:MAG: alginate export family protein [Candidatus Omnitrophota bacterium]|jgi:hypothetical protein